MKTLLLGIDALDSLILEQLADELPNLTMLRTKAMSMKLRSTFPPDSDTAWATISTGLNPAQHGIVRFVDTLEKSYQIQNIGSDNEVLQGKTFWELVGNAGYRVKAIFPHLCHPLWETPGTMVVRGSSVEGVQAIPSHILEEYPNRAVLNGVRGFPERGVEGLTDYARKLEALTKADADFALKLLEQDDWDLFFVYWSTIDATGHFFWNYFDPEDPSFEEGHPLQQVIPNMYKLYDAIVGKFLAAVDRETTVIVMSDHGHGTRPFKLVSVNELLRKAGYLTARNPKTNPHINIFEKVKRAGIYTVSRYGLGKVAGRMLRSFPSAMQSFTRPSSIDWDRTLAYASDMSGIKSYSYGGIMINRDALDGQDYEALRNDIIEFLKKECILPDGTKLLDFVARREDLYEGPYIEQYPDIILEFKYGYGVGWAVHAPLITQAASHNLVPGSHRGDTGTFLMRSQHQLAGDSVDLQDITPTILDLMGVPCPQEYNGKSILAKVTHEIY